VETFGDVSVSLFAIALKPGPLRYGPYHTPVLSQQRVIRVIAFTFGAAATVDALLRLSGRAPILR
jgi:hypothetical protein